MQDTLYSASTSVVASSAMKKLIWKSCLAFGRRIFCITHVRRTDYTARPGRLAMKEVVLLSHVLFGVACLITTVWLFVDVLNAHEGTWSASDG